MVDAPSAPLRQNELVVAETLATRGPLPIVELQAALAKQGVHLKARLLERLPSRHPSHFHFVESGVLAAGRRSETRRPERSTPLGPPAWATATKVERPRPSDVAVVAINTTGLDPSTGSLTEATIVWLDGREHTLDLQSTGGSEADLIDAVAAALSPASLIIGHNHTEFAIPFLRHRAESVGQPWAIDAPLVDTITISLLVWPDLERRTLDVLCRHAEIPITGRHTATGHARAAEALFRHLVAQIAPDEPSWRLAVAILEAAEHPLCAALPPLAPLAALEAGLESVDDPLLVDVASTPRSASVQTTRSFEALQAANVIGDRPGQRHLAREVARTLDNDDRLLAEAPTGTGKTLAYLAPALGKGTTEPVVIATATKVLQRQLRDEATRLAEHGLLAAPIRQVLGVSNYLCVREIADAARSDDLSRAEALATAVAARALADSLNGVWDDVTDSMVARADREYRIMRQSLRTSADECERHDCEFRTQCPMMKRLGDGTGPPGVVITNHAMVGTWIAPASAPTEQHLADARDPSASPPSHRPGRGLLDRGCHVVFDEAHELEDTLTSAWTEELAELSVLALVRRAGGRRGVVRELWGVEPTGDGSERASTVLQRRLSDLGTEIDALGDTIRRYLDEFGPDGQAALGRGIVERRREFQVLKGQAIAAQNAALQVIAAIRDARALLDDVSTAGRAKRRLWGLHQALDGVTDRLGALAKLSDDHAYLHVLAVEQADAKTLGSWRFESIPIEVGPLFERDLVRPAKSVVLTSATLRAGGSWDFLRQRLGIEIAAGEVDPDPEAFRAETIASPFDFANQSEVILTNHLPVPTPANEAEFVEELAADHVGLLSLTGGRALTLFAARRRMESVAAAMEPQLPALADRGVRLLVQGKETNPELMGAFRADEHTAAFGLRSFWQGFDAPGPTLSYLLIEKPPYPHPGDLVIAARQRRVQEQGGDPFLDYVVPKTAILFAQGFGRLIRRETDRGVAIICDRRMQSPGTATQTLLDSLPGPKVFAAPDRDAAWTEAIRFVTGQEPDLSTALGLRVDEVGRLLEELRFRPGADKRALIETAAQQIFGIDRLHPEQLQLMLAIADGRDAIGVLPTGFGKSLCFQLPALLNEHDRPTVVVSPLIALIKDQVDALRGRLRLRPVQGITGMTSAAVRTEILRDVAAGAVRLLYVSPERLARDRILQQALAQQDLGAIVVDEAHCVSVWGHDFRPEFRQIPKAVEAFRRAPRVALTATATLEVAADIETTVALENPERVRRPADRHNLHFRVQEHASDRERARELIKIATHFSGTPGIVYASRRATSEELAALLRKAGFDARHYHAGMVPEQRTAIQDQFIDGLTNIIVATKAVGMGIDKPDIGWVVHYDLPDSLDGYAQEAGRAARRHDLHGHCVLLYTRRDIGRRTGQAHNSTGRTIVGDCQRLLAAIRRAPTRAGDYLIDAEEIAAANDWELDDVNRMVAWLERVGTVDRRLDCTVRGSIVLGSSMPADEAERRTQRELRALLRMRPGVKRLIDLEEVASDLGLDPDGFEDLLVSWTLDRHITFNASQRRWRLRLTRERLDERALRRLTDAFAAWQVKRVRAMIDYAGSTQCRRTLIGRHFGDPPRSCLESNGALCDACATLDAPWAHLTLDDVADPEQIVDVGVELLRAVKWASSFDGGNYGEETLVRALLGVESFGNGFQLSKGALSCPQFGSLKYVRGAEKRLRREIDRCVDNELIARTSADYQGRSYPTLTITPAGRDALIGGKTNA